MFFVRMIRLVPLVLILLVIGVIIYLVAQAKYNPPRAKQIVIKVFFWINLILLIFFTLLCLYAFFENNKSVFELFLSFAFVPLLGLLITITCYVIFIRRYPNYKYAPAKTSANLSFKDFWKEKIIKFLKNYINKKTRK